MRPRLVAGLLCALPFLCGVQLSEEVDLDALVQLKWGLGTRNGKSQLLQLLVDPELDVKLPADLGLTFIGRLRADAFDRVMKGRVPPESLALGTRPYLVGDQVELELRELYLDGDLGPAYFRIGKQQLVWGQADGLKLLDVVNPQDFREFILEEFDISRFPLWTLNVEVPIEELVLQVVWIPDLSYHRFPTQDSLFQITSPRIVGNVPKGFQPRVAELAKPTNRFTDSDAGLKLSTFWRGWDLSLNYLYHYWDTPAPVRELSLLDGVPTATFTPTYERTHTLGGTFSNTFGDLTLRGELAYHRGRFFPSRDTQLEDGLVESDELTYVVGLDWYGFAETLLSVQVFQSWLIQPGPGLFRDQLDTNVTALARREFWNDVLALEVVWIHDINEGDGLVRPKASYEVLENLQVWAGFDVFYGTRFGLFGQFGTRDRFVLGLEWGL